MIKKKQGSITIALAVSAVMIFLSYLSVTMIKNKVHMGYKLDQERVIDQNLTTSGELAKDIVFMTLENKEFTLNYTNGVLEGNALEDVLFEEMKTNPFNRSTTDVKFATLDLVKSKIRDLQNSDPALMNLDLTDIDISAILENYTAIDTGSNATGKHTEIPLQLRISAMNRNRYLNEIITCKLILNYDVTVEDDPDFDAAADPTGTPDKLATVNIKVNIDYATMQTPMFALKQTGQLTAHYATSIISNLSDMEILDDVSDSVRRNILQSCIKYSGITYKQDHSMGLVGGEPPKSLDCSAYVWKVYNAAGISVPLQTTRTMYNSSEWNWIPFSEIKPGDIILGVGEDVHHVMIYAGYKDSSYYVFEAQQTGVLSGLYTRSGATFDFTEVKPADLYNNRFYAYRHKSLD